MSEICNKTLPKLGYVCSLPPSHKGTVHVAFLVHDREEKVLAVFEIPEPVAGRLLYSEEVFSGK